MDLSHHHSDGGVCIWCGRAPWPQDVTIEHVLPRSRRGHSNPENLATACRPCNRARRSKPVVAYVRELQRVGVEPRLDLIERTLARMEGSRRRPDREYAEQQLRHLRDVREHERVDVAA